ncbi:MAG: aminotransferase class V-fold PLP-dependent enzyme [Christensenellales bacterium]
MYALSGHKIHGPKGIGVLAVRPRRSAEFHRLRAADRKRDCVPAYNSPACVWDWAKRLRPWRQTEKLWSGCAR